MKYVSISLLCHMTVLLVLTQLPSARWPEEPPHLPVMVSLMEIPRPAAPPQLTPLSSPSKILRPPSTVRPQPRNSPSPLAARAVDKVELPPSPTRVAQLKLSYAEELKEFLESHKKYPRPARQLRHSGVVNIRVIIQQNGQFSAVEIAKPAPFATLNEAALKLFKSLGGFKPLPAGYQGASEFIIPIAYQLRGQAS